MLTRIALLLFVVVFSGCIFVPAVWDAGDEIYLLDFIEPGVTTKDEVLSRLGEPDRIFEYAAVTRFTYAGHKSGGGVVIPFPHVMLAGEFSPSDWWVHIDFDKENVVTNVVTEVSTSEGDLRRSETAEQPGFHTGSVAPEGVAIEDITESKRRMYFRRQLKMACAGDKPAQYLVALHYDRGEGVERDKVQAFKWYSLAHPEWPEAILGKQMTPSEIAEAKRLVAEWRPNQVGCAAGPF